MIGFGTSAFMINTAFEGWADDPTITTLDTIAAPISDVQFPTVTVCNNELENPPDNWGFLENFMNLMPFTSCFNNETCNEAKVVREEFRFLTKHVMDEFLKWLLIDDNLSQSSKIFKKHTDLEKKYQISSKLNELVQNGDLDMEKIKEFPTDYFQKPLQMILEDIGFEDLSKTASNCTDATCLKVMAISNLMYEFKHASDYNIYIGSFLRYIIPHLRYDSFHPTRNYLSMSTCYRFKRFCMNNRCNLMKEGEKYLHDLFSNMSISIGFGEKLSLYELPSLLAITENMFDNDIRQTFTHTRCQKYSNFSMNGFYRCAKIWSDFVENNVIMGQSKKIDHIYFSLRILSLGIICSFFSFPQTPM